MYAEKAVRGGSGDNLTVVIARVVDDGRNARLIRLLTAALGISAAVVAVITLILALI